jgi:tRNA pseudouridine55 synthase
MAAAPSGVLVVDKPRGPTSHDVVAKVRRALGTREVGHAGTLDPMATGVLVVLVGEATKLAPYLTADDKAYEARVRLGEGTDTLDAEGTVVATAPVPDDLEARLDAALEAERARTEQVPPAYSAVHAGGTRAHELARRGEVVELAPRPVAVRSLERAALRSPDVDLVLVVSKGYYVRSLARDLAARLSTVGHLVALRRTRSGAFGLEDAVAPTAPELAAHLVPIAQAAARALPVATLDARGELDARCGRRVRPEDRSAVHAGPTAWLSADGSLVAIGVDEEGSGRVLRGFR